MSSTPFLVRADVQVRLPDGTRLATDIYRPGAQPPAATVLLRTPYGKAAHLAEGIGWTRRGFAFVVQDVRGRYDSEGRWRPFCHERPDGAAVVEWLAQQDWSSGRIIVTGGSYAAFTAWAAALHRHPAVRAIISLVPAMGLPGAIYSRSGVLRLGDLIAWWMTYGDTRTQRPRLFEAMCRAVPSMLTRLPVTELPSTLWADLPTLPRVIGSGPDRRSAGAIDDEELARLDLPAMHIGGWHDVFVDQTLHHWTVVGSAVQPRPERRLIIGPWTHTLEFDAAATVGERQYGPSSRRPLGSIQVAWLRQVLGISDAPATAVTVFLMGTNHWLDTAEWPPHGVSASTWYAQSGGRLAARPAHDGGADRFVYDPGDPFPSRSVPVDRADLDARVDAVRYVTAPLEAPASITGNPVVTLYAATDGPGTDWVARLLEVLPDGRTLYLSHGLVDSGRELAGQSVTPVAGRCCCYRIPMKPTAVTVPAGHRLCLEITSSDFPEHARNLNTGADRCATSTTRIARQTIFHGSASPTALSLPVSNPAGPRRSAR